jgi:hypothetical protein
MAFDFYSAFWFDFGSLDTLELERACLYTYIRTDGCFSGSIKSLHSSRDDLILAGGSVATSDES